MVGAQRSVDPALLAHLRGGGLALLNTDTLPGLHALASVQGAAGRLAARKPGPAGRPFLLLFASLGDVLQIAQVGSEEHLRALERVWPGPLTALLSPTSQAAEEWVHTDQSIALRVPGPAPLRALLERLGAPLFSTSANRAGEPPAPDMEEAQRRFPELPHDDLGIAPLGLASTLVDLRGPQAVLLRPGSVEWPPTGRAGLA